jgi:integrase
MPRKKKDKQRRTRGEGCIFLKRGWYYLKYRDKGETVYEATGTKDEEAAKTKLRDRINEIAKGNPVPRVANRITFEDLKQGLITDYKVNKKKTLKWAERRINLHLEPFFGKKKANEITQTEVKAFIAKRQEENATNGEINRELSLLKRMYNIAIGDEIITRKPKIDRLQENNIRKGFFERREFEAVLVRLPVYLKPPIAFAYQVGWRILSEILPLTWAQVDLDSGTVRLEPGTTKNKEARPIYLPASLMDVLEAQWREHLESYPDCPWVFHNRGERIFSFYKAWHRACREAGVSGKIPHDFRRTAVRNMVRAGIPERVAMQVAGHKTRAIFDRYHIVADSDLREAARKMEIAQNPPMVTTLVTIPSQDGEGKPVSH